MEQIISGRIIDAALRDLFDLSPAPLCISTTEINSRYIKVNPAYLKLVGRSMEEVMGRSLGDDLAYPLDDPARLQRLNILATQGHYDLAEVDMLHSSGRIIPTLVSARRRHVDGESFDIEVILDISERKALEEALFKAANTDAMTGLYNRRAFDEALRRVLEERREDESVVLTYMDLNGFKAVNDLYGHATGDALLRVIASRLQAATAKADIVARLGGDEFAILMIVPRGRIPRMARFEDLAARTVENIRIGDISPVIGVATGVAVTSAFIDSDRFLNHADGLMYEAKMTREPVAVRMAEFMP